MLSSAASDSLRIESSSILRYTFLAYRSDRAKVSTVPAEHGGTKE